MIITNKYINNYNTSLGLVEAIFQGFLGLVYTNYLQETTSRTPV